MSNRRGWWSLVAALLLLWGGAARAGVYVTETSGVRFNDVGGVRFNDVGGVRFNDVGGIRFNDVGGVRFNDVGGILFTDASGVRFNDVGGVRFNDVGGLEFDDALATGETSIDLELLNLFSFLPDTSSINVIVTFRSAPTPADLADLQALGVPGGTIFRRLPMVVVNATRTQIQAIAALPAVRSVWADRTLSFFDADSRALIGAGEAETDPELTAAAGGPLTGEGVTIAVLDTGVDAGHPDLPYCTKVVENVRLSGSVGSAPGFLYPTPVEGVTNTDLVLGHGTFVASVAAGSGAAGAGRYRGVATGASVLSLSAGDVVIIQMLEGFDYILDNASRFGVRVVNCSWGTQGFFDPDDPVNVATRQLYDAGIVVVFAAGNHGPSPDTLNPYAVAPWVIGVGSTRLDGELSGFSSRGIFEELIYHPRLVAPGEGIIAAKPAGLGGVSGTIGVADPSGGTVVPPEDAPYYTAASGTSFAAPHVAGTVALMLQAAPDLAPADVNRILQLTAVPMLRRARSEVGAGRLDAWAAATAAADPARPFGTHVAGWLDERPYRIDHLPAVELDGVVPAAGEAVLSLAPSAGALSWQLGVAWGDQAGSGDLDVAVEDDAGTERARAESFNGPALYGRAEGVQLLGGVPTPVTARLFFKGGLGLLDQPFHLRHESALPVLTAYGDVDTLTAAELATVTTAVARHVLAGRDGLLEPGRDLTRGELARAVALAGGAMQRLPSSPTFADTPAWHPDHPYVESIAGARARAVWMEPAAATLFAPDDPVTRLDYAVAVVRAAGLEAEATARAGEALGTIDEHKVPLELRGFAAVALERGFLANVPVGRNEKFCPARGVPRLEAAGSLLLLLP